MFSSMDFANFVPEFMKNVKAAFYVEEANLYFTCDDAGVGDMRVFVLSPRAEQRCHLHGKNEGVTELEVVFNFDGYPPELLMQMYHMARCKREYERTGEKARHVEFADHRSKMLRLFDDYRASVATKASLS